ncbi:MAG: hypothetical protein ACOYB2_10665 [Limnohabitans sp.]
MEQITTFVNDPLVAPLYALLVISIIDMLLAVYRSVQQKVFDWRKLPEILDSMVLSTIIPLAALGAAAFFVTDPTAKTGLQGAYIAACAAALAAAVASLIKKITGGYAATTKEQDKAGIVPTVNK